MPDQELSPGELRRWLGHLDESFSRLDAKIDARFDAMGREFVRHEVFTNSATAQGTRLGALETALREKADLKAMEDTRRIANWALGLVCTVTFGVLVTGILALVRTSV